ncbi:hypothetical protein Peur_070431 [Populus x canadensis]
MWKVRSQTPSFLFLCSFPRGSAMNGLTQYVASWELALNLVCSVMAKCVVALLGGCQYHHLGTFESELDDNLLSWSYRIENLRSRHERQNV